MARSRWFVIAGSAALVTLLTVVLEMQRSPLFTATAILATRTDERLLLGTDEAPTLTEQTGLIPREQIAARALRSVEAQGRDPGDVADSVSIRDDGDVLAISVMDAEPRHAEKLAAAFAFYTGRYLTDLHQQRVVETARKLRALMMRVARREGRNSAHYALLREQFSALAALNFPAGTAFAVRPAAPAEQVAPDIARAGLLGFLLGLLLAVFLTLVAAGVARTHGTA